jgi:hypothetical protein
VGARTRFEQLFAAMERIGVRREAAVGLVQDERRSDQQRRAAALARGDHDAHRRLA